jgi:cysteine synthase
MPETVWWDVIDDVVTIDDQSAYRCAFELARKEGYLCGSSGGMALAGARQLARELGGDQLVVTLIPDSGERYLSKLNREWLAARDLL